MLIITIPESEYFDESLEEFVTREAVTLELEHSLVSLSKWESKWEVPFMGNKSHTEEMTIDYIRMMTLNDGVPPEVYYRMSESQVKEVTDYINAKMTATTFADEKNRRPSREIHTAEVIYYWMIAQQIPFECQHWHLNRLLTLIRVVNEQNKPKKKMARNEVMARNRALNQQRREAMQSRG